MNTRDRMLDAAESGAIGYVEEGAAAVALMAARGKTAAREPGGLPAPSRLIDNAFAFQRTAALRAAIGLDLFTAIAAGRDTPRALAQHCAAAERGVRRLCDFLVALGLLEQRTGRYAAAPDAATYLDRGSPAFIGDALDFAASDTHLKAMLSDPVGVVRKGKTILGEIEHFGAPDHVDWTTYARAVAPMMARSAEFLADLVIGQKRPIRRVLDIAAGPGQNGIALARRLVDAQVTAVDWPSVLEIAAENARAAGLGERWIAQPGSALETEFVGPYDVALVVRFLHLLAPRQQDALLRRVHAALAPGGRLVALQIILNEDHASPPFAAAMNFNVLATTLSGEVPTTGEFEALLRCAARWKTIEGWFDRGENP